ncbi:hypothetical protein SAY87_010861 [Trapa incisa]|uniref:Exopolygalacturonase n=1 Tax=Trapa incisa TaxID=236973 RepID=A0AAN7JHX4_9MYRT|nr:hypothetical protein SAY87_010861 [Trapa incisa]
MAKTNVRGGEYCIHMVTILLAMTSLCEGRVLLMPFRGLGRSIRGSARPKGGRRAKDALAAQLNHAMHGSDPTEKVFNVLDFKADARGRGDSTQAFMRAWVQTCHWNGKSRMLVPRGVFSLGEVVFQGKCNGPSAKVVEIKGTLKALDDPSSFLSDSWILFQMIHGVIIFGGGTLNGQGPTVWKYNDCQTNPNCQTLPINLKFDSVSNAILSHLAASRLVFNDIVMNNVKRPITIDQNYNPHNNNKQTAPSRVKISNVHYANIRGTSTSFEAVSLVCSRRVPCEMIQMKNINLRYIGSPGNGPITSTCLNTHRLVYEGIQIPPACK